jgi:hypothetical protein
VAYPVNLQVVTQDSSSPRVWVVQRRAVSAAEWNFDPNPDIASFVNGMSVRPVIGIPWSEDNAALFDGMEEGTVFNLTMNTGAILRYEFAAKTEVLRSDTRIFRQVGPGLVLLLIGETDDDGLPTGTRTLITATYPPEQELSRGGELVGLAVRYRKVRPDRRLSWAMPPLSHCGRYQRLRMRPPDSRHCCSTSTSRLVNWHSTRVPGGWNWSMRVGRSICPTLM